MRLSSNGLAALAALLALLPAAVQPSQPGDGQPAYGLSLVLKEGQVWRQSVLIGAELELQDGRRSRLDMDLLLRMRCVESGASFGIEAAFTDWRVELSGRDRTFEWHGGHFRCSGNALPEDPESQCCKTVMKAWSEGFREMDLRFRLLPNGTLEDLRGFDSFFAGISRTLEACPDLPAGARLHLGAPGLRSFRELLILALSTPRPEKPVVVGEPWLGSRDFHPLALPSMRLLNRSSLLGVERIGRFRVAQVDFQPRFFQPGTDPAASPESLPGKASGRLSLVLDSGLVWSKELEGSLVSRGNGEPVLAASFRMRTALED
ncbi:MAG: hypothetical protein ACE5H3_04400 [Planctomycetota bacterium]